MYLGDLEGDLKGDLEGSNLSNLTLEEAQNEPTHEDLHGRTTRSRLKLPCIT